MLRINDVLELAETKGASDIHFTVGLAPILRIDGDLVITDHKPLNKDGLKALVYSMLNDDRKAEFEKNRELDFSLALPDIDRYRVNIHYQRGGVEAALRRVPQKIPSIGSLGLPKVVYELIKKPNGLILVTGPTGTGKSTTLAAMVDFINQHRKEMIISIEDPIEFIYENKKSIVKQREIFSDTQSFPEALRRALRQDPDVIVVGEMRDLETISTALTAAETGHLVLATLHTPDAPQTVQRIIDVFPPHQQRQVTVQLAECIQAVISQVLLRSAEVKGRILATEIMVSTPGIRNLIRESDVAQIPSLIQMGAQYGMHTMDKCLKQFYKQGLITKDTALRKVKNLTEFENL